MQPASVENVARAVAVERLCDMAIYAPDRDAPSSKPPPPTLRLVVAYLHGLVATLTSAFAMLAHQVVDRPSIFAKYATPR